MRKRASIRKPSPTPTDDNGLVPKTIRFHPDAWREIEARANHIAPAEWLRAKIYEEVLGNFSPSARERAA